MSTVDTKQESQLLYRPKESPRLVTPIRLFVLVFILLPVCVLTVAYVAAPDAWRIRHLPGTVATLFCLTFVFFIGVYIVKLGPKIPRSKILRTINPPPSWPELIIWFCFEILYWLALFLMV
jgi:hypothetical protein